jgi:L-cysteine/cystine lyase
MPAPRTTFSARVRSQLPATEALAYLNTGTTGPLPSRTHEVMAAAAAAEHRDGRASMQAYQQFREQSAALRGMIAAALGADQAEIALTRSTTEGMNIAVCGLDWKPDDIAVTTTVEHGGALLPLYQLRQRHGVRIEFAEAASGEPEEILAAMESVVRPGVKLVVLSHVAYGTGAVLPVRAIAALAHEHGALVLVDGAQSVGATEVDFHALGADFYAFPGQKWLCGPDGTGGLYVSATAMQRLQPTYVGFGGVDHEKYQADDPDSFAVVGTAARYEAGTFYRPAIYGLAASLTWLHEDIGLSVIHEQVSGLREYCVGRLGELDGVRLMAPAPALAGLVAFRHPDLDPVACVAYLAEHGVSIRSIPGSGALRLSCGFYNTRDEIDRTIGLIADLLPHSPRAGGHPGPG